MGQPEKGGEYKHVVIKTTQRDGAKAQEVARIPIDDMMKFCAEYWRKRVNSRARLSDKDRLDMRQDAIYTFENEFKIHPRKIEEMALKGVVQVTIPWDEADFDPTSKEPSLIEYALEMPWEYLLSAVTKKYRNNYQLFVVRHLDGNNSATQRFRNATKANAKSSGKDARGGFCIVETAPLRFSEEFDFSNERKLCQGALGKLKEVTVKGEEQNEIALAANPSIGGLEAFTKQHCPDVFHFTGIDTRLGASLLKKRENAEKQRESEEKRKLEEDARKLEEMKYEASKKQAGDGPVAGGKAGLDAAGNDDGLEVALLSKAPVVTDGSQSSPDPLSQSGSSDPIVDGLYFANGDVEEVADYLAIAKAVSTGERKAQLIGLNVHYSGARIAPACIAQGAREALGIQNTLSDSLSERFFFRFYQHWNESGQDSLAAFIAAWEYVRPIATALKGSGIILWFNTCVFERSGQMVEPTLKGIEEVKTRLKLDKQEHVREQVVADPAKGHKIQDLVSVDVEMLDVIAPCKLHYGESVLNKLYFLFKNLTPGTNGKGADEDPAVQRVDGIDVEVTLNVGSDSYPYRTRVSLGVDNPNLELTDYTLLATDQNPPGGIQVPLTSDLIRTASDNIRGSLFVNIEWGGQILLRHTYSVKIAAVNEWRLNEKDSLLQPMYVQPRDKAVQEIIANAQRYLKCYEGDMNAGFKGYQACDIEPQLKAIWAALVIDYKLDYVSPPPSYNNESQRLRTPAQVLSERQGTCVDLALLLASCMEWIELYPVIINTQCHSFVGCWAFDQQDGIDSYEGTAIQCYQSFLTEHKEGDDELPGHESYPWVFTSENYGALYKLITQGSIIPVEATCLTEDKMFQYARDYAIEYFQEENVDSSEMTLGDFESVTDVKLARNYLQPLPLA